MIDRYLKAIAPALLALTTLLIHLAITGQLDGAELELALGALAAAIVTAIVPNRTPHTHDEHHQQPPDHPDTTTLGTPTKNIDLSPAGP